jgi:hypothetical protein
VSLTILYRNNLISLLILTHILLTNNNCEVWNSKIVKYKGEVHFSNVRIEELKCLCDERMEILMYTSILIGSKVRNHNYANLYALTEYASKNKNS